MPFIIRGNAIDILTRLFTAAITGLHGDNNYYTA